MAITRAQVEKVLLRRRKGAMVAADLDSTTQDGTNADVADPLARSMRRHGYVTADPTSPADSDLATVPVLRYGSLLDLADLYLLEACQNNFNQVSYQSGTDSRSFSDLRKDLMEQWQRAAAAIAAMYPGLLSPGEIAAGGA